MLDLRSSYHLTDRAVELRAFTHGLMPKRVPAMMERFVRDWQERGVDAWNEVPNHWLPESGERVGWWTLPAYLGDRFVAPLLGALEGTCIMQPNAHWTIQCLLSSAEIFAGRQKVILTEGEFPSVRFSLRQWAGLLDIAIEELPLVDGSVDEDRLLAAVDDGTALVLLSHVGFTTGAKLSDAFIGELAHRVRDAGGLLVLDGYHSIGAGATSVSDLGVDVYIGGMLKEGSGSSGNGFVYIRPGLELTPRTTGWFGDAAPFAFAERPLPHEEIRWRFLGGTTAIAPLYHAVEGVRLLLDAGLDHVRADTLAKARYAIEHADRIGLTLRSPREPEAQSAMLVFETPHADRLCRYLKTRGIYTDSRQGRFLRMAPFVWNTRDELNRTFDAIEQALRTGAHLEGDLPMDHGPVT